MKVLVNNNKKDKFNNKNAKHFPSVLKGIQAFHTRQLKSIKFYHCC